MIVVLFLFSKRLHASLNLFALRNLTLRHILITDVSCVPYGLFVFFASPECVFGLLPPLLGFYMFFVLCSIHCLTDCAFFSPKNPLLGVNLCLTYRWYSLSSVECSFLYCTHYWAFGFA